MSELEKLKQEKESLIKHLEYMIKNLEEKNKQNGEYFYDGALNAYKIILEYVK